MPHPHLSLAQQITLEFERGAETAAGAVVRQPGIIKQKYITLPAPTH